MFSGELQMIEGLKITVDGRELADLCKLRAAHHRERAAKYAEQVKSMESDQIEGMNYTNGNPIQSLKDRQSTHEGEAGELDFIAAHLVVSESYLLGRDDLVKLGVTKSRY
jgi:hypothetical protein